MQQILNVHIGEVKIAKKGELLKAILGSCVGIGIIWKRKKMCGLAHCLLSENPEKSFSMSARYVDQAIASLFALMKISPDDFNDIDVIVVGGGNVTNPTETDNSKLIGGQNVAVAERELKKLKINIHHQDTGGTHGRKISIDSLNFEFNVDIIPRLISKAG